MLATGSAGSQRHCRGRAFGKQQTHTHTVVYRTETVTASGDCRLSTVYPIALPLFCVKYSACASPGPTVRFHGTLTARRPIRAGIQTVKWNIHDRVDSSRHLARGRRIARARQAHDSTMLPQLWTVTTRQMGTRGRGQTYQYLPWRPWLAIGNSAVDAPLVTDHWCQRSGRSRVIYLHRARSHVQLEDMQSCRAGRRSFYRTVRHGISGSGRCITIAGRKSSHVSPSRGACNAALSLQPLNYYLH